ncbi:MAG: DUF131 domain-containing protein [Methanomassiliicoccus sp.]|nr:DUF131 domain-containing protein [Methanomassiliicoccus sp.]
MDRFRAMQLSGAALVLLGIVVLAWAAAAGQVSVALVLIVPVLYGTGPLVAFAALAVFAGMVLLSLSLFGRPGGRDAGITSATGKREWGGVVLIGPIPIVFGSPGMLEGRGVLALLAALSIIVLLLFLFISLR